MDSDLNNPGITLSSTERTYSPVVVKKEKRTPPRTNRKARKEICPPQETTAELFDLQDCLQSTQIHQKPMTASELFSDTPVNKRVRKKNWRPPTPRYLSPATSSQFSHPQVHLSSTPSISPELPKERKKRFVKDPNQSYQIKTRAKTKLSAIDCLMICLILVLLFPVTI